MGMQQWEVLHEMGKDAERSTSRITELERQVAEMARWNTEREARMLDLRYGLLQFCDVCEKCPPLELMERLKIAYDVGRAILDKEQR